MLAAFVCLYVFLEKERAGGRGGGYSLSVFCGEFGEKILSVF